MKTIEENTFPLSLIGLITVVIGLVTSYEVHYFINTIISNTALVIGFVISNVALISTFMKQRRLHKELDELMKDIKEIIEERKEEEDK